MSVRNQKNNLFFVFGAVILSLFYSFSISSPCLAACVLNGTEVRGYTQSECQGRGGTWRDDSTNSSTQKSGAVTTSPSPQSPKTSLITGKQIPSDLGNYIKMIYVYGMGIVGIVATIVIMVGGFVWLSSLGNASRINDAKEWIGAALSGLALALFSYTILWIINPDLVNLKPLNLKQVESGAIAKTSDTQNKMAPGCCVKDRTCTDTSDNSCVGGDYIAGKPCDSLKNELNDFLCTNKEIKTGGETMNLCSRYPLPPGECTNCVNCVKVNMQANDGEYLEAGLAKALEESCKGFSNTCKLSEGYPPKVSHGSQCHSNGTCFDQSFVNPPTREEIKEMQERLDKNGLRGIWEVGNTGGCTAYTSAGISCRVIPGVSPHFHVEKK